MSLLHSVTHGTASSVVPDTLAGVDLFAPAFPSATLVHAAGALLAGHREPERLITVGARRKLTPSDEKSLHLFGVDPRVLPFPCTGLGPGRDHELIEGPRTRITLGPGVLMVARKDPARAERAADRAAEDRVKTADQAAQRILSGDSAAPTGVTRSITAWSRKSRANMVKILGMLDYSPLFTGGDLPAMLTLTYPGEWEEVAPDSAACTEHVKSFRKRFQRAWKQPLRGIWKREFQRRGAPHYHVLMVPPRGTVNGQTFREWAAHTWADIVAHPDPLQRELHVRAGIGVDYAEGMRGSDPRRLAVYFSKHGAYADKEYQNHAPELWQQAGSVGRFWGVWGLDKALSVVEVTPAEGLAATRTMRRHARANGYSTPREVWRAVTTVDVETGEVLPYRWRRRRVNRRVRRMRGDAGFVMLNDAPVFVSQLSRYLDQVREGRHVGEPPLREPLAVSGGDSLHESGPGSPRDAHEAASLLERPGGLTT